MSSPEWVMSLLTRRILLHMQCLLDAAMIQIAIRHSSLSIGTARGWCA
jgi:hypothetical protein